MPSVCLVAGDPSGDAHAARLVEALKRLDPTLTFTALGGPQLKQAGVRLLDDLTRASSIGPFDAAWHLGRFIAARQALEDHLRAERPEVVLLVDFGDFNLPVVAPLAKRYGCRVIYYISPQLWAWGRFRLRWVRQCVDRMIVLFRFEEDWYRGLGIPVTWAGHPLVDTARPSVPKERAQRELGLNPWRMTVGLLPGSRRHEVARHLPVMLAAARQISWHMPGIQFLLPKAPQLPATLFQRLGNGPPGMELLIRDNRIYDCLQVMDGAIVASGTATLEAALFHVPMTVVYRTSLPTYLAAKSVVKVPHIAMVNVIAGRQIVPEFVQHRATSQRIAREMVSLLRDENRRATMRADLQSVTAQLGPSGAVDRAAKVVLDELRSLTSAK